MPSQLVSGITIHRAQCNGLPCIRRMRVRVIDLLELLGSGADFEEILDHYPYLEREDILSSTPLAKPITRF